MRVDSKSVLSAVGGHLGRSPRSSRDYGCSGGISREALRSAASNLVAIDNRDTPRRRIPKVHNDIAAHPCCRRKRHALDSRCDPNRSHLLRCFPGPYRQAPGNELAQPPIRSLAKIDISCGRNGNQVGHSRIIRDFDPVPRCQNRLAGSNFPQSRRLVRAGINSPHPDRREPASVHAGTIAADHVVRMEVSKGNRAEEGSSQRSDVCNRRFQARQSGPAEAQIGSPA